MAAPSSSLALVLGFGLAAAMPIALVQNRLLVPLAALMALGAAVLLRGRLAASLAPLARGPFAAAALLSLWAMLSALWAIAPERALAGGLRLLLLAGALAVILAAAGREGEAAPRAALMALIAGVALGAALLMIEQLAGAPLNNALRGFPVPPRNAGVTKPAATLLALLAPPALVAAGRLAGPAGAVLLAVLAAAAVFSGTSEAARLGLAAALAAGGLAYALPALTRRALPALLALAVLVMPPLLERVAADATRAGMLPLSAVHRTLIWDYAAERAAERPVLGFGMDAARSLPGGRDNPDAARLDRFDIKGPIREFFLTAPRGAAELIPLHTHSMPLQIRLELGAVGLGLFALFAFLCGRAAAAPRSRAVLAAAAATAAAAAVVSLLSYGVWQHWWWVSVALAASALTLLNGKDAR